MKNRILAGLLALIFGAFGVHRFYLKDIGGGIFFVFLTLITQRFFPVGAILGILDAIRIFNMSNQEFDEKYNKAFVPGSTRGNTSTNEYRNTRRANRKKKQESSFRVFPKKNPFKKSALEKFKNYDFKGAIEDYKKALDISPEDPELHFEIAKAYSLTENKELSFRQLDTAVQYGLKNPERIGTDEDLAYIRIQPEYQEFKDHGFRLSLKTLGPEKKDILQDDLLLSQINKLKELRNKGVLSEDEFEIERKKITLNR
ncbi:MAG: NINE protein [Saprospiraceae bacterium]